MISLLATGSLLGLVACADVPATAPTEIQANRNAVAPTGPWARIVEGTTGPGSLYALYIPTDWNREAIFYVHGFRDARSPVDLRDQDGLATARDMLGAQGYAVAWSSFSENGFVVKDGAQRTHQLRGLLASQLKAQPERSYLFGYSLGGGIGLYLAEKFPQQYDGALLVCGMVGGSLPQTQYLGHVRTLFDFYFPGVLQGNVMAVPEDYFVNPGHVVAAVTANP